MPNVMKTAIVASVFLLMTFLALELSLRVYLFGPTGFSPEKVGSFSLIFNSGLVQAAKSPEIWYELKPNQAQLFRGVPFRTNSFGLADQEYALEKPVNTVRIAVVGSSWTMGSAVLAEETYHSLLEQQFNAVPSGTRFEFINFGVENYGLQEIMATARDKAILFNPDMILLEITESTPAVRWAPHTEPFVPLPPRSHAWDSMLWLRVAGILGIQSKEDDIARRYVDLVPSTEYGVYFRQIERALTELGELGEAHDIPVAAVWLRVAAAKDDKLGAIFLQRSAERGVIGAVADLDRFLQPGESIRKLLVSRVEPHPNPYGHQLIAEELRRKIFDTQPLFQVATAQ